MRRRFCVGEGTVGKPQSLIDSAQHPQCEGVENLRYGTRIMAEALGEITMARLVVELDRLLIMSMGAGKVAGIPAGGAGSEVRDQGLGAIRAGGRFAQEQLCHFAHRYGFAAVHMPKPQTVIGGEPFRGVFLPARQFAGARKGGIGFRRRIYPLVQISALPRLVCKCSRRWLNAAALLTASLSESAARRACASASSGNCRVGGKPSTAGASTAYASASRLAAR